MAIPEMTEGLEDKREESQENDMLLVFQSLVAQEETNKFLFSRISALDKKYEQTKCIIYQLNMRIEELEKRAVAKRKR